MPRYFFDYRDRLELIRDNEGLERKDWNAKASGIYKGRKFSIEEKIAQAKSHIQVRPTKRSVA